MLVSFPIAVREHADESNPKEEGLILDHGSRVESREQELEAAGQIPSRVRNREQEILLGSLSVCVRHGPGLGMAPPTAGESSHVSSTQRGHLPGHSRFYQVDSPNSPSYHSGRSPFSKLS